MGIEKGRALQATILETIIMHSPSNLTLNSKVQDIVQEYLGLRAIQLGVWSGRDDEGNEVSYDHQNDYHNQRGGFQGRGRYVGNREN